jgi:hypothetical protein
MKMKAKRRVERDRARRDPRGRLRTPQGEAVDGDDNGGEDLLDTDVARSLLGYDE